MKFTGNAFFRFMCIWNYQAMYPRDAMWKFLQRFIMEKDAQPEEGVVYNFEKGWTVVLARDEYSIHMNATMRGPAQEVIPFLARSNGGKFRLNVDMIVADEMPVEEWAKSRRVTPGLNYLAYPEGELSYPVEALDVSLRALGIFLNNGLVELGEVAAQSEQLLLRLRGCGKVTVVGIAKVLKQHGLHLGMTEAELLAYHEQTSQAAGSEST